MGCNACDQFSYLQCLWRIGKQLHSLFPSQALAEKKRGGIVLWTRMWLRSKSLAQHSSRREGTRIAQGGVRAADGTLGTEARNRGRPGGPTENPLSMNCRFDAYRHLAASCTSSRREESKIAQGGPGAQRRGRGNPGTACARCAGRPGGPAEIQPQTYRGSYSMRCFFKNARNSAWKSRF